MRITLVALAVMHVLDGISLFSPSICLHILALPTTLLRIRMKDKLRSTAPVLRMAVSESIHRLGDVHDTLFKVIQDQLHLKSTDFSEFHRVQTWTAGPHEGRCEWFDEVKGSKLTGVSKYSITRRDSNKASFSIDGWLGPSLLVPHMLLRFGCDPDAFAGYSMSLDFIPRGPTPLGSDANLMEKYYGPDTIQFYDSIVNKSGVSHLPPSPSFSSRLLRSPLFFSVAGLGADDVMMLSKSHVERWLRWLGDAAPVDARQRGAINSRDDKQRQFQYRSVLTYYQEQLEDFASDNDDLMRRLSAGSTGPIAEAYIGGGS